MTLCATGAHHLPGADSAALDSNAGSGLYGGIGINSPTRVAKKRKVGGGVCNHEWRPASRKCCVPMTGIDLIVRIFALKR
jgi:hypothetical protein